LASHLEKRYLGDPKNGGWTSFSDIEPHPNIVDAFIPFYKQGDSRLCIMHDIKPGSLEFVQQGMEKKRKIKKSAQVSENDQEKGGGRGSRRAGERETTRSAKSGSAKTSPSVRQACFRLNSDRAASSPIPKSGRRFHTNLGE
jgi:hypothetical protein